VAGSSPSSVSSVAMSSASTSSHVGALGELAVPGGDSAIVCNALRGADDLTACWDTAPVRATTTHHRPP